MFFAWIASSVVISPVSNSTCRMNMLSRYFISAVACCFVIQNPPHIWFLYVLTLNSGNVKLFLFGSSKYAKIAFFINNIYAICEVLSKLVAHLLVDNPLKIG